LTALPVQDFLPIFIALLAVIAAVYFVAPHFSAPPPVLLALAGASLAIVPGLPRFPLNPDLILVLFLPPLLYADAFDSSWTDFRRWLRPIVMLATGLVALTTFVVGIVAHTVLPDLPWPVCFVLGAIVSPTDTVAAQAVIERLRVPRRITAILGGESLVNDATGLVGVQVGVAVTLSGAFEAKAVALEFAWVAGGGIAIGLIVGLVFALLNRLVREGRVLFVLSLLSPYLAFLIAHSFNTSGVLAVVIAGFVVAWRMHRVPAAVRVELYSVWKMLVFVLNGLCFVFVGIEAPHVLVETNAAHNKPLLLAGLAISAAVIVVRIVWCFPGAYLPLWLSPRLRRSEGGIPPARSVLIVAWCGMRGIVSLAAALALPHTLADGTPFPGRDEIIACTLAVILVTLIAQGLSLQPLIRWLGLRDDEDTATEVRAAREAILSAGIARLDAYCSETSCPLSVHHLRTLMVDELMTLTDQDDDDRRRASARLAVSHEVRREVVKAQDAALLALRDQGRINDKTYMHLQLDLDRSHLDGRADENSPSNAGAVNHRA
jgi:monovalent cation/hydrogen antiporter